MFLPLMHYEQVNRADSALFSLQNPDKNQVRGGVKSNSTPGLGQLGSLGDS